MLTVPIEAHFEISQDYDGCFLHDVLAIRLNLGIPGTMPLDDIRSNITFLDGSATQRPLIDLTKDLIYHLLGLGAPSSPENEALDQAACDRIEKAMEKSRKAYEKANPLKI